MKSFPVSIPTDRIVETILAITRRVNADFVTIQERTYVPGTFMIIGWHLQCYEGGITDGTIRYKVMARPPRIDGMEIYERVPMADILQELQSQPIRAAEKPSGR